MAISLKKYLKKEKGLKNFLKVNIRQLLVFNQHLGNNLLKINNFISSFFFGVRQQHIIFNLNFTFFIYRRSIFYLIQLLNKNGKIFIINQNVFSRIKFKFLFNNLNVGYLNNKWLNGLLTGFYFQLQSILRFFDYRYIIRTLHLNPVLKNYLKKKQNKFKGILNLNKRIPSCVIFANTYKNLAVLHESNLLGISSIGFLDSSLKNLKLTYGIPSNDRSFIAEIFLYIILRNIILLSYYYRIQKIVPFNWEIFLESKLKKNLKKKSELISLLFLYKNNY